MRIWIVKHNNAIKINRGRSSFAEVSVMKSTKSAISSLQWRTLKFRSLWGRLSLSIAYGSEVVFVPVSLTPGKQDKSSNSPKLVAPPLERWRMATLLQEHLPEIYSQTVLVANSIVIRYAEGRLTAWSREVSESCDSVFDFSNPFEICLAPQGSNAVEMPVKCQGNTIIITSNIEASKFQDLAVRCLPLSE